MRMARSTLAQWVQTAFISTSVWIVCEVAGGLFFLAFGLRLWEYHLIPVFSAITSPVIWLIAYLLMPPLFGLWNAFETKRNHISRWKRCLFLILTGCTLEVLINDWFFKALFQTSLFTYTFLPTFDGSGSWLSPLYYLTLYLHFPINDWLMNRSNSPPKTYLDSIRPKASV